MLEIQKYLIDAIENQGQSVELALSLLTAKYGIKVKSHAMYPNLLLFKYDQIESPMGERIVQECRGIILDEGSDNWAIVARVFDKFFNHGEGHAAQIDWKTAKVQEKLDGSLCVLYEYDRKWNVATSGSPDASGNVGDNGFSFNDLFWKAFRDKHYEVPSDELKDLSFAFELTSKFNRVVVHHSNTDLRLIGVRDRLSGQERDPCEFSHLFEVVQHHDISTIDALVATFEKLDPIEHEGYVVVDGNFNRVKIKHPGYVALHHLKEGFGKARILEVIRSGEKSEFLTYFPEWQETYDEVKAKYDNLLEQLIAAYEPIKHIENQKEFALLAQKTRCPGALFSVRNGRSSSFKHHLSEMNIKALSQLIGLKEESVIASQE